MFVSAHEDVQELEDPLVGEDVEDVPRLRVEDGQSVDLVLQQEVDGVVQTAGQAEEGGAQTGDRYVKRSRDHTAKV